MILEEILWRPWLEEREFRVFIAKLRTVRKELEKGCGPVLVAEKDSIEFLAVFFGAILAERAVVMGSFSWGKSEWEQAVAAIGRATVFSEPGVSGDSGGLRRGNSGTEEILEPGEILIPTGGSSGQLRFARHRWDTLVAAAEDFREFFGVREVNSYCVLPVFHVSGLMQAVRAVVSGGKFVPLDWAQVMEGEVPELADGFLSLVPTQVQRLLERGEIPPWVRELRAIPVGGAASGREMLERAAREGLPLAPSYGMTETAAMVTAVLPEEFLGGRRDCGRALPHAEVRVREGRVEVRADSLFSGYLPGEVRSREWWETGDLGEMGADGGLQVFGRAGRWIVSGGEKISLEEVERAVGEEPGVTETVAFGVEDPTWGHALVLAYVGGSDEAEMRAALRRKLAAFKIPKTWFLLAELPRNSAGKVDRGKLAELAGRVLVEERGGNLEGRS